MSCEPVFERAGTYLLEQIRKALVPAVLQTEDGIQITFPKAERDYRVGICLYDVEEVRPYGTPRPIRNEATREIRGASRSFILHFLVYANQNTPFDSMTATDEMVLIEAVMRAIHNSTPLELEGEKVELHFDKLSLGEKTNLWQSFSSPIRPAVYLSMEPLVVPSTKLERYVPVREVDVKSGRKPERKEKQLV